MPHSFSGQYIDKLNIQGPNYSRLRKTEITTDNLFETEPSMPCLLTEYDVVGFDADQGLVKYNVPNMTKLLIEVFTSELVEGLGYPSEVAQLDNSA